MKPFRRVIVLFAASFITLSCQHVQAQGIISFSAKNTVTTGPVVLDSILVKNITRARQLTLIGKSTFDLSILSSLDGTSEVADFSLHAGYPNAFTQNARFGIDLHVRAAVDVTVRSLTGAALTRHTVELGEGRHLFTLSGEHLPAGTYIVDVSTGSVRRSIKLVKLGAGHGGAARVSYDGIDGAVKTTPAPVADMYTFVGYAAGFVPDTLLNIIPAGGMNYEFLMVPLPASDGITAGPFTELLRRDIPASGGIATVNAPGNALHGMQIEVPRNSYPDTRSFVVSSAPVLGHSFGTKFTPASPLIRITNGGGYTDSLLLVRIPISIRPEEFAMAFFYDEHTRELEGIPIVALSNDTIVVATRHLSAAELRLGKGTANADYVDLIVAAVDSGKLNGRIMSGFRPGVDDWEYPNGGSVIAANGHCLGQSISAMWYYSVKKLKGGAPGLNTRYSEVHTDSMWMDNTRGYKLSSILQNDYYVLDGSAAWIHAFDAAGTQKFSRDMLHSFAFKYALAMIGKPQFVGIRRPGSGHALVVYGVDNNSFFVADPNYPGEERVIVFSVADKRFLPYQSKPNVHSQVVSYPEIKYYAKTAFIPFGQLAARWSQFEAGTLGTVAPNTYPATSIWGLDAENGTLNPLPLDFTIDKDTVLKVFAKCEDCPNKTYDENCVHVKIVEENGRFIARNLQGQGGPLLPLRDGTHRYGLVVMAYHPNAVPNWNDNTWRFVDFHWITVTKTAPKPAPRIVTLSPSSGKVNDQVTITGTGFGTDAAKAAVYFGSVRAANPAAFDSNRIVVRVPAGAKSDSVYVSINGVQSNRRYFSVAGGATIVSITPSGGYAGDVVVVRGTGLKSISPTPRILFNGEQANLKGIGNDPSEVPVWTDSLLHVVVPKGCVRGDFMLYSSIGGQSNTFPFGSPEPNIRTYYPSAGSSGTWVTVEADFFGDANWPQAEHHVTVDGTRMTNTSWITTDNGRTGTFRVSVTQSGTLILRMCGREYTIGGFTVN